MKRSYCIFFTVIWLLILACLFAYYLVIPAEPVYSEQENRMLKGMPTFSIREIFNGNADESTEGFLLDRFPRRYNMVSISNKVKDICSIATYKDYLSVQKLNEDKLDNTDDIDDIISDLLKSTPTPVPTPPSTPTPAPSSTLASTVTPGIAPKPTPSRVPSPSPTPRPIPEDFNETLGVYMKTEEGVTQLRSYKRNNVLALTEVLGKYADCLKNNGKLIFTMVPQSYYANKYVASKNKQGMYSDFEACMDAFSRDNMYTVSATDILGKAIDRGEYVYFRTDMHWTPEGTYLVYSDMVKKAGLLPASKDEFNISVEKPFLGTYYRDNPTQYMKDNSDILELYSPKFSFEWRRITGKDTYKCIDLLNYNAKANDRYTVYLGGPAGPWTYMHSDNGKDKNALVITDSFGLAFIPMLSANYKDVHYYDTRYFSKDKVGYSVAEMISKYDITDCYVVIGDLHSFESAFIIMYAQEQLTALD